MTAHKKWILLLTLILAMAVSACAAATPEPTPIPPTLTPVPPSATPLPPTATATVEPTATPTDTPVPTDTPPPTATELPTDTPIPTDTPTSTFIPPTANPDTQVSYASGGDAVTYLISLNTGGPVACGDSAIGISAGPASGDMEVDVKKALQKLFSIKDEYVYGLYNPLYRSNIRVESVNFRSDNGLIEVHMRGTYKPSGDDCDSLRVKAQIWLTIRQFRGVNMTNIYLNGIPFGDRVSNDK